LGAMRKHPQIRPYAHLQLSLRLLKLASLASSDLQRWRVLRSIAGREHLHRIRHSMTKGTAPAGALLKQRRIELASWFQARGYQVHPALLRHQLPAGPSGFWLEEICPYGGPQPTLQADGQRFALPAA